MSKKSCKVLQQKEMPLKSGGPLIAAQAIAMGAVCITDNLRHFLRVSGLIVENWLQREKEG